MRNFLRANPSIYLIPANRRIVVGLFYFQLVCSHAAFSQRALTAFGAVSELQLGFRPLGLTTGLVTPSNTEIVVIAPDQPVLRSYELNGNGRISQTGTIGAIPSAKSVAITDLTNDGIYEYVVLAGDGNSLFVIRHNGSIFQSQDLPLQRSEQHFLIADINKDGRKDILFFGKNNAGITTMLCQANGKFKSGPVLFPEISVSDLLATDLNGDSVADLLMLNWLSNELTVGYQIGRLVFSELVSVPLGSEPSALTFVRTAVDKSFRIAIALPEARSVNVYAGNALGDYRLMRKIECTSSPRGVEFAHINADEWQDLVVATDEGLCVSLATSASTFSFPIIYGTTQEVAAFSIQDLDGDGSKDCVLIDTGTNRLLALANSEYAGGVEWPSEYAVGFDPRSFVLDDLNGDGKEDIAVVNGESASLSLLLAKGRGRFWGQQSVPVSSRPNHVRVAAGLYRNEKSVLISHARTDEVSVVTFSEDANRSRVYSVPTGLEPYVVTARNDSSVLHFVVRYRDSKDRSFALSSFTQISSRQFVERSLRSTLPSKLLTMNVDDGVTPGSYELLFATNDKGTRTTTVSIASSEVNMQFRTAKPLFSYPDSASVTRFLESGFFNADAFKDIVVVLGHPRNEIGIWYGKAPTAARDSIEWIRNVRPISEDAIVLRDVNDDKATDITWLDGQRKAIVTMFGTEKRGFRQPVSIVSAEGVSSFRIGSLQDHRAHDLVLSNADRGTITIVMNPFGR